MKKLLFLLIPLFVIAQNPDGSSTITFKDIMSIDSKDTFLKIMLDNKYSGIESDESEIAFALNPQEDGTSTSFAYYYSDNRFWFQFTRTGTITNSYGRITKEGGVIDNTYDTIYEIINRRCEFVAVKEVDKKNYACYDCRKAKFDGLIGLTTSGQSGFVTAFAR